MECAQAQVLMEPPLAYNMFFGFDLAPGTSEAQMRAGLTALTDKLVAAKMLQNTAPLGRRDHHPVLDTAAMIPSTYFTTMQFQDRAQADAAVKLIYARKDPTDSAHQEFIAMTTGAFFLCFQDGTPPHTRHPETRYERANNHHR